MPHFVVVLTPGDFILGAFLGLLILIVGSVFALDALLAVRRWLRRKMGL